jgi:catechol 2,3-dioxygenase-like lactoylglutathione lyase family enzyme
MLGAAGIGALVTTCSEHNSRGRAAGTTRRNQTAVPTTAAHRLRPLIRKIDHVFAIVEDPRRALQFMNETLKLPSAWPFTDYGSFASGGINLGNLNLEFVDARGQFTALHPARVTGVGFEPATTVNGSYAKDLGRRSVAHGAPEPGAFWTNISFENLMGPDIAVFATDYHIPALKDAPARQKALDDTRGGRLGVVDAAELVLGVVDIDAARRRWQPLLAPAVPDAAMGWTLGRGPALRLVHHERNEVLDLALGVASPSAANDLASLRAHDDPLAGLPLSCTRR